MNKIRRKRLAEAIDLISQAKDILEEVKDEEQEAYDNLPESFQYGERGEQMQEYIDSIPKNPLLQIAPNRNPLTNCVNMGFGYQKPKRAQTA